MIIIYKSLGVYLYLSLINFSCQFSPAVCILCFRRNYHSTSFSDIGIEQGIQISVIIAHDYRKGVSCNRRLPKRGVLFFVFFSRTELSHFHFYMTSGFVSVRLVGFIFGIMADASPTYLNVLNYLIQKPRYEKVFPYLEKLSFDITFNSEYFMRSLCCVCSRIKWQC